MSFRGRFIFAAMVTALLVLLLQAPASAQDLSDTLDGSSWWNPLSPFGSWPQGVAGFDPYCSRTPTHAPNESYQKYKTFTNAGGSTVKLPAFEFDPPTSGTYPAIVLIHGGGWKDGCALDLADEAYELSQGVGPNGEALSKRFIVVVDYRLACDSSDPNVQGSAIQPLCGWNFKTPDGTDTRKGGAAIHDVEDAVGWVRANYNVLHGWAPGNSTVLWDGKNVLAAGASSGGNLAYMAAALGAAGATRPDEVAGWSGPIKIQRMSNGAYGCDGPSAQYPAGQSGNFMACWMASNKYADCTLANQADPTCQSDGTYGRASPIGNYDYASGPPVFIANGGGPATGIGLSSAPELIGLQEAVDFKTKLDSTLISHLFSVVDQPVHATAYLGSACDDGNSETVLQRTADFLGAHLIP